MQCSTVCRRRFGQIRLPCVDVVFQYRISGTQGGEWFVSVKEGSCQVEQGTHEKPTTTIIMSDEDFLSLISGKLNAMQAFTTGS